jgi:hypothetical protein
MVLRPAPSAAPSDTPNTTPDPPAPGPTRHARDHHPAPAEGVGGRALQGAGTPLAVGPPAPCANPFLRANENLSCNHNVQHAASNTPLPHDVATYEHEDADYNWRIDAYHCYLLAYRLKGLAAGFIRPATPAELYWAESHGQIA